MQNAEKNRTATQQDVEDGTAVFFVAENRSRVYALGVHLPAPARLSRDFHDGNGIVTLRAGTLITVLQAEIVDDSEILIGFRVEQGDFVCSREEIELDDSKK